MMTANDIRVLGIVPARGGSKGIPRKNLALLCGQPLLRYTAEAALAAGSLSSVVLSTDDPEIAEVGRDCGLKVPFLRPPELARDDTPTLPVLQHAIAFLEDRGERYDAVCQLQPTNPLRRPEHIDGCVELFTRVGADAVATLVPVPTEFNPHWVYFRREDGTMCLSTGDPDPIPRRQLLPPAFRRDGSVYVTKRDVLMEANRIYGDRLFGYLLDPSETVDINTPGDLTTAEDMLRQFRSSS